MILKATDRDKCPCFRFVAAATMDMDFLAIDINQCPIGIGNEAPNFFAGTAKCKATTMVRLTYLWNIYLRICNHRNWPGFLSRGQF